MRVSSYFLFSAVCTSAFSGVGVSTLYVIKALRDRNIESIENNIFSRFKGEVNNLFNDWKGMWKDTIFKSLISTTTSSTETIKKRAARAVSDSEESDSSISRSRGRSRRGRKDGSTETNFKVKSNGSTGKKRRRSTPGDLENFQLEQQNNPLIETNISSKDISNISEALFSSATNNFLKEPLTLSRRIRDTDSLKELTSFINFVTPNSNGVQISNEKVQKINKLFQELFIEYIPTFLFLLSYYEKNVELKDSKESLGLTKDHFFTFTAYILNISYEKLNTLLSDLKKDSLEDQSSKKYSVDSSCFKFLEKFFKESKEIFKLLKKLESFGSISKNLVSVADFSKMFGYSESEVNSIDTSGWINKSSSLISTIDFDNAKKFIELKNNTKK